MNLSELSMLVCIGAGAAGGAHSGSEAGIIGAVSGILAGGVTGYATGFVVVFLPTLLLFRAPTEPSRSAVVAVVAAAIVSPYAAFFLASQIVSWAAAALS